MRQCLIGELFRFTFGFRFSPLPLEVVLDYLESSDLGRVSSPVAREQHSSSCSPPRPPLLRLFALGQVGPIMIATRQDKTRASERARQTRQMRAHLARRIGPDAL